MKRISVVLLVVGLVPGWGCNSATTPTSTGGLTSATQVFSGTVAPGETPFSSFTLPATQPLHIMFASLTDAAGVPLGSTVTLQFGVLTGIGGTCDALTSASAQAALRAQINVTASAGSFCVALADTGSVPVTANYSIRVVYGTPSDETNSGTITYDSSVLPGGFTARSFGAAVAGTATLTMDTFSPASVASLGLGVGIQRNDGSGCEVSTQTTVTRGGVLQVPLDAGRYCVRVFDLGTLTDTATFSLRILHP